MKLLFTNSKVICLKKFYLKLVIELIISDRQFNEVRDCITKLFLGTENYLKILMLCSIRK